MPDKKEIKKLLKELRWNGWEIKKGKTHFKCYHPKGGFVSISATPSDPWAYKNILGDIKRLEKANELR